MCKEPESLVAIVSSRAKQVVLVGDHKQLQPIILDKRAKNLGLGRSLFQRYADSAIMLTEQYRMVGHHTLQHHTDGTLICFFIIYINK